ncbi:hypothetical protein CFC21_000340 [Triticum aestivum]|uniref:Uncharacterized protein n=1 Tax=Triticum aestivum TaxID=4565 RepID=A0A3B5XTE7_WHEAT|nr:hypothetical protein CFC21_000340 [Triticum aestivum]
MSSVDKKPEGGNTGTGDYNQNTEWPELVGKLVEEAKKVILQDKPERHVMTPLMILVGPLLMHGDAAKLKRRGRIWIAFFPPVIVTMEYRIYRVRLFVDRLDTVAQVPRVG